jgi:transcriptional regulator with XRE-family HTH domain
VKKLFPFKIYREASGLKQVDVARRLGIKQSTVSMWETGTSRPRVTMLPLIAKLYGCTVDALLNQVENK